MLEEMGIQTGVDLVELIAASRAAQETLGRTARQSRVDRRTREVGAVTDVDHQAALEAANERPSPVARSATARRRPSKASCPCGAGRATARRGIVRGGGLLANGTRMGSGPTAS